MKIALRVEGEITQDGHLVIDLPPELPRGRVVVTFEPVLEEVELSDEDLKGAGLTAEEIAASPEIGSWAEDDIESGAEYVEKIRRASPRYVRLSVREVLAQVSALGLSTPSESATWVREDRDAGRMILGTEALDDMA
jgi:hypothetical protein